MVPAILSLDAEIVNFSPKTMLEFWHLRMPEVGIKKQDNYLFSASVRYTIGPNKIQW